MADEHAVSEPHRAEDGGQAEAGLARHVVDRPGQVDGIGAAVAGARIDEDAEAGRLGQSFRKVAPQRDASQALMQEDERRRRLGRRTERRRLEPPAVGDDRAMRRLGPGEGFHGAAVEQKGQKFRPPSS